MRGTTVARILVDSLVSVGVSRVYGIPGDSLNAVTDAIRTRPELAWVPVHHEEAAAFAASAEAQLTGRLAVCAGSCGPGNLHLINGLYDAHRSRAPVLGLAAQIPSSEVGTGYFQETSPELVFRECSGYCAAVTEPGQLPRLLSTAVRGAVARRDVSVLVLPGDIAWSAADPAPSLAPPTLPVPPAPPAADVERLTTVLNGARRVTILAGAGCASAHDLVVALADRLHAPVVHTIRGKESLEGNNPFDVGMTGLLGFASGYYAMADSDVLLLLGTDFPYRAFYPRDTTTVQVDIRGEQIGKRVPVDLGIVGDVGATVAACLPGLAPRTDRDHLDRALAHYAKTRRDLDALATGAPGERPVHPQYVARLVDELAGPDAVITCDVGEPTVWAARYVRMNGRRRLLGSFVHGSMAGALPLAIGAKLTMPERPVISLSGDGGLSMMLGELLTLAQLRLPVTVVVFNNGALGFVELEMKAAGLLPFATDLGAVDFAAIARAAGLLGLRAESADEVRPLLVQALSAGAPAVVDVPVQRQEVVMPPTITWEEFSGFSLFMIKAVLSGRGDEVVDLAKTALFR
jgi:pyruvate dehydrogenase (quinone)